MHSVQSTWPKSQAPVDHGNALRPLRALIYLGGSTTTWTHQIEKLAPQLVLENLVDRIVLACELGEHPLMLNVKCRVLMSSNEIIVLGHYLH